MGKDYQEYTSLYEWAKDYGHDTWFEGIENEPIETREFDVERNPDKRYSHYVNTFHIELTYKLLEDFCHENVDNTCMSVCDYGLNFGDFEYEASRWMDENLIEVKAVKEYYRKKQEQEERQYINDDDVPF